MYDPTQLPDVDAVDVLVLDIFLSPPLPGTPSLQVRSGPRGIGIYQTTHVTDARAVAALCRYWRMIPEKEQYRCHDPICGLRFYANGNVIVEASICWQCNNMWLNVCGENDLYTFDGESEPAQELLRLMRYLSGEYWKDFPGVSLSLLDYL